MADLESTPTTVNPTLKYDLLNGTAWPVSFNVAPKDSTGAVIDLTGYNDADVDYFTQGSNGYWARTEDVTISGAGPTGATITFTATNVSNIMTGLNGLPGPFVLTVNDGTDKLIAAQGTLVASQIA